MQEEFALDTDSSTAKVLTKTPYLKFSILLRDESLEHRCVCSLFLVSQAIDVCANKALPFLHVSVQSVFCSIAEDAKQVLFNLKNTMVTTATNIQQTLINHEAVERIKSRV